MKHRFWRPRASLVLALALFAASAAWADSTRVGDTAADKGRDDGAVDFNKWSGTTPKDIGQADVNKPTKVKLWTPAEIVAAKDDLLAYANKSPSTPDSTRVRTLLNLNPSNVSDDMNAVWFTEWLRLQSDVTAQFIKPPPNKIKIVDQDRLSKMTDAEKASLKVHYRKTTICEKTVTYKPEYKTIEVAYPG